MSFKQYQQFNSIFPNGTIYKTAIDSIVFSEKIKYIRIHSAIWKFYLLIFPNINSVSITQANWMHFIANKREEFKKIQELHSFSPHFEFAYDSMGPLSTNEGSRWNQYHKDNELKNMISRDTDRLFQDIPFFQDKQNIDNINDIIFLHLKNFPEFEYRQGFHEICGIIYYNFCLEMKTDKEIKYSNEAQDTSGFNFIFSGDYIKADAFWIYSEIIKYINKYYEDSKDVTFISKTCYNILQIYMKRVDWDLSQKLIDTNLEIMMYQWFRILFGRIFQFEQINQIWSYIFSYFPGDDILSSIAMSLILTMKTEIINCIDKTEVIVIFKNMHSETARQIIDISIRINHSRQGKDDIQNLYVKEKTLQTYKEHQDINKKIRNSLFEPICKETEKIMPDICENQKEVIIDQLKKLRDAFNVVALLTCNPSKDEIDLFTEEPKLEIASSDIKSINENTKNDNNSKNAMIDIDSNNVPKMLPKATSGKLVEIKADQSLLTEEDEQVFQNKKDIFSRPTNPKNLFE